MTDRDSPVTADELHAYVDGMLPADRKGAVEAWLASHPEDAARVAEWRAQAEAVRARYGAVADEPVPARFDLAKLTRPRVPWRAIAAAAVLAAVIGGVAGWIGARRIRRRRRPSVEIITARGAQRAPALHRRGAPSDRGARRRAASDAVAVEARRHQSARSRPEGVFAQAPRRPAAARPDRTGGAVHVREPERRALHHLLLALEEAAHGAALPGRRRGRGDALGRERDRLCGERAGRPRPARARSRRPPTSRWRTRPPRGAAFPLVSKRKGS